MRHKLAFRLPALVVVAVVVAVTVGAAFTVGAGRNALREQTVESTQRKLDGYLSGVEQYLTRARELLALSGSHIGSSPAAGSPGGDRAQDVADGVLNTSAVFEFLMLIDLEGVVQVVRTADSEQPATRSRTTATRPWFREARGGQFAVGDLELSLITGNPSVIVAVPIVGRRGAVVAVWAGGLQLDELSRLGSIPGGEPAREAHGYVTDRTGLIVAHQGIPDFVAQQTDFSSVPPVQRALAGASYAGFHWNDVERREKVAASTPLPGVGWAVVFASPAEVALRPIQDMTEQGILAAMVSALLMALASWLLVSRALRPLQRLREAAATLGAGDLTARVDAGRRDEVGTLAVEMNRMAANLESQEGELRRRAADLERTVEALDETLAQRDATVAELDGFSYSVSHDLRAPLRAISGFTEAALQDSPELTPESRESLTRTVRATKRMSDLIDDMLRLSRVSRSELQRVPVDLTAAVQTVLGELREQEPARSVEAHVQPGMTVLGDPQLLAVALRNLVSNAWKFTAKQPYARIDVSLVDHPDGPEFVVRDNGAGFDPAYADRLFTPFQRLHRQSDYPGSGIGLAIVRRIALRHQGGITATASPGAGAEFRLQLPPSSRQDLGGIPSSPSPSGAHHEPLAPSADPAGRGQSR